MSGELPGDPEALQALVPVGWQVEAGPATGQVSFLQPFPKLECREDVARDDAAVRKTFYAMRNLTNGESDSFCYGTEFNKGPDGELLYQFRLTVELPIPPWLMPALDRAGKLLVSACNRKDRVLQ